VLFRVLLARARARSCVELSKYCGFELEFEFCRSDLR
jgi:hypothetical protein